MERVELTYEDVRNRARALCTNYGSRVYGVPNGGVYAALAYAAECPHKITLVEDRVEADLIIDDIVDSGTTRRRYEVNYPGKPFLALVDKQGKDKALEGVWVSFPWERQRREDGPQDAVRRLLQYIGEDPEREGLRETPARVVRSYEELFAGYKVDVASLFKTFSVGYDQMVLLRGVPFTSTCEHHLMPFSGLAHVAYVPKDKVIGLSKLARLVEAYARRLQVQERLTCEVTTALDKYLEPLGSACVVEASHSCMACRGVNKPGAVMVTSSLTGSFRHLEARAELMNLIRR